MIIGMAGTYGKSFVANWYVFLTRAADARKRAMRLATVHPNSIPDQDAFPAILLSAAAAESFINELAEAAKIDGSLSEVFASTAVLRDLGEIIGQVEAERGSIILKYQLAKKVLDGSTFQPGRPPFQDFVEFMKLRNVLVHPRSFDQFTEEGHMQPQPPVIRALQQRGLTQTRGRKLGDVPGGTSWLYEVECSRTAEWAYNATHNTIKALLELLPDQDLGHVYAGFRSRLVTM